MRLDGLLTESLQLKYLFKQVLRVNPQAQRKSQLMKIKKLSGQSEVVFQPGAAGRHLHLQCGASVNSPGYKTASDEI
jgi:hypothetical protein